MRHIGRKLFHLLGGLNLLSLYFLLSRELALGAYAALTLAVLCVEVARMRVPAFNAFFFDRFGSFIRENERGTLTGTAPYVLGVGCSLLWYRTDIAAAAVCFLAVGDVAATTVGERFGRTKIAGKKSLEGTIAFAVAAACAGALLRSTDLALPYPLIFSGAAIAAAIELLPLPMNDNFTVPVITGGAMTYLCTWLC